MGFPDNQTSDRGCTLWGRLGQRWGSLLLAAGGIVVIGCGGVERVPVTGRVYYRDQPLSYGAVMFQPVDGGPPARSPIQSDGTFVLTTETPAEGAQEGVQVGACRVRVTAFSSQRPGHSAAGAEEPVLGKSAIPKKYQGFATSGIVVEVAAGMQLPIEIRLD